MASICLGPIFWKMAGDTRSVVTLRDSKCQVHPYVFGWIEISERALEIALDRHYLVFELLTLEKLVVK